jgi:serine/threonine-protein kinase
MLRICSMSFAAVLVVVAWFIVTTTGDLGDPVATHFDGGLLANGWMQRSEYLAFSLTFSAVLPLVIVAIVGWLPRLFPASVNLPNRDYWLAPERSAATFETVAVWAILLGALLSIFMAGVHWLILQANAVVPPQLPAKPFWTMLIAFLAVFAFWIWAFWSRFRDPSR